MNDKKKNFYILVCYEKDRGGETKATEAIYRELSKNKSLKLKAVLSKPLWRTDFLGYFAWILAGISKWARVILSNRNADWIYTTTFTAGFTAALLKPLSNFKICFHYHGSRLPEKEGKLSQWIKYKVTFWLHQFFLKRTDLILAPSNYSKDLLKKQLPVTKSKKIVPIPNGVDLKVFKPVSLKTKLVLRKKYNIKRNAKVILAIGRLNKEKRVGLLFPVISLLKDKIPNILLLITYPKEGTKDERIYKRKLKKQITELGISDYVLWLSGEKNIANTYAMSDLVILASEKENFPLIMFEALASKVIFVSTPVGGVKQILPDIDKRLVIKNTKPKALSEQLISLLNLSNRQKDAIRQKGYKLAQQSGWKKIAKLIFNSLSSSY